MDRITGPILALDLASRAGFCVGLPSDRLPRSGSVVLKDESEHRRVAAFNFMAWLDQEFSQNGLPALIVTEAPMNLFGFANSSGSTKNARLQYELHGIVGAVSWKYGLRIPVEANVDTIRKHFMGFARAGTRAATKQAVIRRAQTLGLMPRESNDDNRADSIAAWEWARAHLSGRIPSELVLFEDGRVRKARRPARA